MHIPADKTEIPTGARLAVLGGCGGIGRELVTAALQRDLRVAVLDLPASLQRHPVPAGAAAIAVDATRPAELALAFAELNANWQGLDGFVNLCGFMHDNQPATDIPETTWHEIINGNLHSVENAAHHALPLLHKGTGACLVNAASGLAHYIRPGFGAYAAAKAAVIALTQTLALENAPAVRVNAIGPSAVDTAFLRGGTGRSEEDGEPNIDVDAYTQAIPLRRIALAGDVVDPILFLLGDGSRYMTGQVLWINGGSYMP